MTLKDLLETILLTQRITLKVLFDYDKVGERVIFDKTPHEEITYSKVAEFLYFNVVTIEAMVDENNQPYLYIEIME